MPSSFTQFFKKRVQNQLLDVVSDGSVAKF